MPASTILLIDADAPSAEAINTALTAVGYTVTTVADPSEAFGKVADHQLAIIDVVGGDRTAFDVCKEIRSTPALAAVPILCVGQSDDVEDRIRFLEAGADDVMAKPFDNRALAARYASDASASSSLGVGLARCHSVYSAIISHRSSSTGSTLSGVSSLVWCV